MFQESSMMAQANQILGLVLALAIVHFQCKEYVKLEAIPNYPGMYFVPQYRFALTGKPGLCYTMSHYHQ